MTETAHDESDGGAQRWSLYRGGVINIWEFAQRTFDYSGGRAVFQGTNGSGKSRTLELQMPLPLDGDLNNMGAKGHDSVSIRRLMLDDYTAGPNRVGYSWLELRRTLDSGLDEYVSCGVGVKASKTNQTLTGSWRFLTTMRIGIDIDLVGPDEAPLDQGELRKLIGTENVYGSDESEAFQSRVATVVYGIDERRRYGDLLNLQRTLRNPDIGVRAVEGELERYLTQALPPLDPALIKSLAEKFGALDEIRNNIKALESTNTTLELLLATYRRYVRGQFDQRAATLRRARGTLKNQRTAIDAHRAKLKRLQDDAWAKKKRVDKSEARERAINAEVSTLELPAQLRSIQSQREKVEHLKALAQANLNTATQAHRAEVDTVENVLAALRMLQRTRVLALDRLERCRTALATSGVERSVKLSVPALPEPMATATVEQVRTSTDPESGLGPVERTAPPALDLEQLSEDAAQAATGAQLAANTVRELEPLVRNLAEYAEELDKNLAIVQALKKDADDAEQKVEEADAKRRGQVTDLEHAIGLWLNLLRAWHTAAPVAHAEKLSAFHDPDPAALARDPHLAAATRRDAQRHLAPALRAAHAAVDEADAAKARITVQQAETALEIESVRSGADEDPARPAHLNAPRHERPGGPFFRLVEFRPDLPALERAGLEAALHACGLLDAWVFPDGRIGDPDLHDILASAPDTPAGGPCLAQLLRPAGDAPVAVGVIENLLRAVTIAHEAKPGDSALCVTAAGRWSAGILSGAATGEHANYIGETARRERRERRLSELSERSESLRLAAAQAETTYDETVRTLTAWQEHREQVPATDAFERAHDALAATVGQLAGLREEAGRLNSGYEKAHGLWQAEHHTLRQRAGEAGLPTESAALRAVAEACITAAGALAELHDALTTQWESAAEELARSVGKHSDAIELRSHAEQEAQEACDTCDEQTAILASLTATLDADAQQIQETLNDLKDELGLITAELPSARRAATDAAAEVLTSEERLKNLREKEEESKGDLATAEDAFTDALDAPGLWLAATGQSDPAPEERDDALILLDATAQVGQPAADELAVHQAHQNARTTLPADRDLEIIQRGTILVITAVDDEGKRPVAEIARRTAQRLAAERTQMSDRYRTIFEDYLLHDLAETLRIQIDQAENLIKRMNTILADARSSQGVHVQLSWQPSPAHDEPTRAALALVRKSLATRTPDEDDALRTVLRERIEAEHTTATGDYTTALAHALDYREWHAFTVRVHDTGPDGAARHRLLKRLSSGETRLISYVTLFAAAAAFYDSLTGPGMHPLRVVLLDEAFERLDDPTITRLLELLVDLDMDWIITWPGASALSPRIPRLHIYDILKRTGAPGIAFVETTWDGQHEAITNS